MIRNIYKFLSALAALILLACCHEPIITEPEDPFPKVLLMYDNIDDNRTLPFTHNVAAAGRAVAAGALIKGQRVIVFHRRPAGNQIYELVRDKKVTAGFRKEILKEYEPGEMSSLSKETIHSVVGQMREFAPAVHYGLVFGSHGTGWLPKTYSTLPQLRSTAPDDMFSPFWAEREDPLTRFLAGYGQKIDVTEFADALDDWEWDFLLLDDCFMASVEALYELREVAEYVIASPTEIMMAGFPYDKVVSLLFSDWDNLAAIGSAYVEAYRTGQISQGYPYATISVVKTSELDALAGVVKKLRQDGSWIDVLDPDLTSPAIQGYEGLSKHVFFDMDDYIGNATMSVQLYDEFKAQLDKTVVFTDHTDMFFSDFPSDSGGRAQTITHYSGLSVFIPWAGTQALMPDYQKTAWYKAVYE